MAFGDFVVEDGTGLTDATSLVSLADAELYIASHPDCDWAKLGANDKRANLMYGTEWLGAEFDLLGVVFNEDQALYFPRIRIPRLNRRNLIDTSDPDTIPTPVRVKEAVIEAALMHGAAPVNQFASEGLLTKGPLQRVKAEGVEVEFTNQQSNGQSLSNRDSRGSRVAYIERLMTGFYRPGGVMVA